MKSHLSLWPAVWISGSMASSFRFSQHFLGHMSALCTLHHVCRLCLQSKGIWHKSITTVQCVCACVCAYAGMRARARVCVCGQSLPAPAFFTVKGSSSVTTCVSYHITYVCVNTQSSLCKNLGHWFKPWYEDMRRVPCSNPILTLSKAACS